MLVFQQNCERKKGLNSHNPLGLVLAPFYRVTYCVQGLQLHILVTAEERHVFLDYTHLASVLHDITLVPTYLPDLINPTLLANPCISCYIQIHSKSATLQNFNGNLTDAQKEMKFNLKWT